MKRMRGAVLSGVVGIECGLGVFVYLKRVKKCGEIGLMLCENVRKENEGRENERGGGC